MYPIHLNFQKADKTNWDKFALLMLVVGIIINLSLFFYHQKTLNLIEQDQNKIDKIRSPLNQKSRVKTNQEEDVSAKQLKQAEIILKQLNTPWADLFNELESIEMNNISLLALMPDVESGKVILEGQADSLQAVFDYMKQLKSKPSFAKAELSRHEKDNKAGSHKIRFSIMAKWQVDSE